MTVLFYTHIRMSERRLEKSEKGAEVEVSQDDYLLITVVQDLVYTNPCRIPCNNWQLAMKR